jgi:prepilin-type processing-associated H-X9-DG protein/prepilin-type N-terminal cleavage/methylation domain-containing protein
MRRKPFFQGSKAFTLIELLVVIAILAIMIALVLPAMKNARDSGNNKKCVSNLMQMGVGLMAYVSDHDGALIPGAITTVGAWYHELDAYMGNQEGGSRSNFMSGNRPKWQCCPAKVFNQAEMDAFTVGYGWNYYGENASTGGGRQGGFGNEPVDNGDGYGGSSKMIQVTKPSQTIIIGDSKDLDVQRNNTFQNIYLYPPPDAWFSSQRARRHSGRGNYLFLDGHVESLPPAFDDFASYFLKVK